uniref:HNH endonuclease n=1 Tax=Mycolicibacterium gilvum (strain PYR-GCK) TaxID=350054 RepID=A4TCU6_MYCGI|nr:HNH endonuclease [Mycolicibacterium gilvum PYR-GCK]
MSRRQGITPAVYNTVMDRGNGLCRYCEFPASEIDHIVPVARGGGNDLANLVPACRECNSEKRDLLPEEWADKRRADGKPWPIPTFIQRVKFLCHWYLPASQRHKGRFTLREPEKFRGLVVAARDCAELDGGAA